jgi:EAL domain-containing protein (putative c-di-GMP-specific phosphodiesterase class I)
VLRETGLPPALLELEVTEDILLDDEDRALSVFRKIQDLGVRLVFDDFGTGFGSLSYLKKFPLDGLKIDRSFVTDLRSGDGAIVSSTIGLSKKLGLDVISEGIEDRATAELLLEMGCPEGQGFFFGKPMPTSEFNLMLFTELVGPCGRDLGDGSGIFRQQHQIF